MAITSRISARRCHGGDGQLLAGKVEFVTEDNQRWSARIAYVKVNPNNQSINKAFPNSDTLKGFN